MKCVFVEFFLCAKIGMSLQVVAPKGFCAGRGGLTAN